MDKIYVAHIYEGTFEGYHGIEAFDVFEAIDDQDASNFAAEESRELIEEFWDSIARANGWDENDYTEDEIEECVEDDIEFDLYVLNTNTYKSIEELRDELLESGDIYSFLSNYGGEEV